MKGAFKFKFEGMAVLASNSPIFMGDDSYGLSRRLIPIPFSQKIAKSDRRDLTAEFTADLPAFTTYLLNLDRDWVTTTLKQANNLKAIADLEWEMTIRTDSIAAFYEEQLIYDPKFTTYDGDKVVYERDWVLAANAYKAYRQFCSDTGFAAKHQNNFCSSLVNLLVDKLEKDVSSRKTKVGKVIDGIRLRSILDPIGDEVTTVTTNLENNQTFKLVDRGDEVTTVTTNLDFSIKVDPKPPAADRPISEPVIVNDFIKYQIVDDRVQYLELAFHKHSIAKEWQSQIELWGGNTGKPHQITRNGKKWLLCVSNLTVARLEQILTCNLGQPPQQPSRR